MVDDSEKEPGEVPVIRIDDGDWDELEAILGGDGSAGASELNLEDLVASSPPEAPTPAPSTPAPSVAARSSVDDLLERTLQEATQALATKYGLEADSVEAVLQEAPGSPEASPVASGPPAVGPPAVPAATPIETDDDKPPSSAIFKSTSLPVRRPLLFQTPVSQTPVSQAPESQAPVSQAAKTERAPEDDGPPILEPGQPRAMRRVEERAQDTARRQSESQAVSDLRDKVKQFADDADSYKKRVNQEAQQARKRGREDVVNILISSVDMLTLALTAGGNKEQLVQGLDMVLKQLFKDLKPFGLEQIDPKGEPFDPNLHEAMVREMNTEVDPGTVIAV